MNMIYVAFIVVGVFALSLLSSQIWAAPAPLHVQGMTAPAIEAIGVPVYKPDI